MKQILCGIALACTINTVLAGPKLTLHLTNKTSDGIFTTLVSSHCIHDPYKLEDTHMEKNQTFQSSVHLNYSFFSNCNPIANNSQFKLAIYSENQGLYIGTLHFSNKEQKISFAGNGYHATIIPHVDPIKFNPMTFGVTIHPNT